MASGWEQPHGSTPGAGGGEGWRLIHQECTQFSPQNNQENPSHKKLADLHLEKYSFPVEMMICLPNGTVVGGPPHPHQPGPGPVRLRKPKQGAWT